MWLRREVRVGWGVGFAYAALQSERVLGRAASVPVRSRDLAREGPDRGEVCQGRRLSVSQDSLLAQGCRNNREKGYNASRFASVG